MVFFSETELSELDARYAHVAHDHEFGEFMSRQDAVLAEQRTATFDLRDYCASEFDHFAHNLRDLEASVRAIDTVIGDLARKMVKLQEKVAELETLVQRIPAHEHPEHPHPFASRDETARIDRRIDEEFRAFAKLVEARLTSFNNRIQYHGKH